MLKKLAILIMVPVFFLAMVFNQSAYAESYFGGSIGVSLSSDASDIKLANGALTGTLTDLDTNSSFAYGIKVGHYFESMPWLGVEFNLYQRDPDVDQQAGTATGTIGVWTAAATGQGKVAVDHLTTYGFLLMLRATEEQTKNFFNIQPYLGIGVGINTLSLGNGTVYSAAGVEGASANLGSDTSTDILLSAGLNYKVTDNIKAYGEYKYTTVNYSAETDGTTYAFDLDDSSLMFGVAYNY